jgi:hypothetical protein
MTYLPRICGIVRLFSCEHGSETIFQSASVPNKEPDLIGKSALSGFVQYCIYAPGIEIAGYFEPCCSASTNRTEMDGSSANSPATTQPDVSPL